MPVDSAHALGGMALMLGFVGLIIGILKVIEYSADTMADRLGIINPVINPDVIGLSLELTNGQRALILIFLFVLCSWLKKYHVIN